MRFYLKPILFGVAVATAAPVAAETFQDASSRWERVQTPEGLLVAQSDAEKKGLPAEISKFGLNCPVQTGIYDEGEDAVGAVFRINCTSANGRNRWKLRFVIARNRFLMGPWPDRQP